MDPLASSEGKPLLEPLLDDEHIQATPSAENNSRSIVMTAKEYAFYKKFKASNPKGPLFLASGLLGCFAGGPMSGLALGLAAVYAHDRPGAMGNFSRTAGDIALAVCLGLNESNEQDDLSSTTKAVVAEHEPLIEHGQSTLCTEDIPTLATDEVVVSYSENVAPDPKLALFLATFLIVSLAGGSLLGLALGLGAVYMHDKPGAVGNLSRTMGDLAFAACRHIKERNDQHKAAAQTEKQK